MSISRFTTLFAIISLILPSASLAQSEFTEGTRAAATPKNDYIVSVQELRMSDKGRKAFEKGAALLEKGEAAASLAYFDQAIGEFPGFYQAHYQLGIAHFRLGHTIEAEQAFQKSIDLTGGGYAPPEFGMGMVLCQKQELERAETVVQPFKSLLAPAQTPLADTSREARDPPTGRMRGFCELELLARSFALMERTWRRPTKCS